MQEQVDLPNKELIEIAANHLRKHLKGDKTVVYLIGYGAIRDWYGSSFETRPLENSVGHIFSEYNENLVTRKVGQSDLIISGLRPLYPLDTRDLVVRGVKHALFFDTSIKERGTPSLVSSLFLFLPNSEVFGIEGYFWVSVTYDHFGYSHFPIEQVYKRLDRPYVGIRGLIEDISRKDIREILEANYHKIGELQEETLMWVRNPIIQSKNNSV